MGETASIPLTLFQGYAAGQAGKYQADIERYNAGVAEMQGQQVLEASKVEQNVEDARAKQILGKQVSSFAGQGVIATAGTAAAVEQSGLAMSEMDKMMMRINASRKAWGYQAQAAGYMAEADVKEKTGEMAQTASLISAYTAPMRDATQLAPLAFA